MIHKESEFPAKKQKDSHISSSSDMHRIRPFTFNY